MSWNYRVVEGEQNGSPIFSLHEVYYDETGKVVAWVEEPETGTWDDLNDLIGSLKMMLADARKRPRLRHKDMPTDPPDLSVSCHDA